MTAPDIVQNLVERFEQHRDAYRSGRYSEPQLRCEFLDGFFEALGWDIFNNKMVPLMERMLSLSVSASLTMSLADVPLPAMILLTTIQMPTAVTVMEHTLLERLVEVHMALPKAYHSRRFACLIVQAPAPPRA
jgi:hypothetical protein